MRYNVKPSESLGQIRLGMTSNDIRSILGFEGILQNENDFGQIEVWINDGIRITYQDKICDCIECFKPAEPYYNNIDLFKLSCAEIFDLFKSSEDKIYTDTESLLFLSNGLGVYFGDITPNALPTLLAIFPSNSRNEYLFLYNEVTHI